MAGSSCAPNRVNTIVPRAPFKTQHPTEIHEVESRIPSGTHALQVEHRTQWNWVFEFHFQSSGHDPISQRSVRAT
ncbi:hypothetical protein K443DRAFT_671404 [Laccaria amethystina LaAM-08-1]|uniref:Uncharacterized protein n=1 Tax=Laccaria amethystina LaAM-08-1 TaxID=1095629 RepID=A0A0C9YGN0_9AGAR|nr:hypothetical protein K443DRAFT_671404 [Laccaria amethystina LaAM-08-1]